MIEQIHNMIQNIINNMKLTEYKVGTVIQLNPMKIDFGEGKIVTDVGINIMYSEQVIEKKIELQHQHTFGDNSSDNKLTTYIVNEGISVGDNLLMLRVANGQKFIILSKLRQKNKVLIDKNNTWNWS